MELDGENAVSSIAISYAIATLPTGHYMAYVAALTQALCHNYRAKAQKVFVRA